MFGYIVLPSNAKKEDKDSYREAYCGLCHVLREKYGKLGALSLSYDMTFLSLVLSDLYSESITEGRERCVIHPFKEHRYFYSKCFDYTSDMQILLSYYSLLDKIRDEKKGENKKKDFEPYIKNLELKYPRQSSSLKNNLNSINAIESRNEKALDKLSLLFGSALGEIFCKDDNSFFNESLYLLGCALGKFIYILDAWDDRKNDEKKGLYNPLDNSYDYYKTKEKLLEAASNAALSYNKLPLDEFTSIFDSIIYSGIWVKFKKPKKGENNNE